MREPIYLGQYFIVKPNTTFEFSGWYHENHYRHAIFKITKINSDSKMAQAACNMCFKPCLIDLTTFHLYYQISNIITIKRTPNQLYP